jgi:hypothetical protein
MMWIAGLFAGVFGSRLSYQEWTEVYRIPWSGAALAFAGKLSMAGKNHDRFRGYPRGEVTASFMRATPAGEQELEVRIGFYPARRGRFVSSVDGQRFTVALYEDFGAAMERASLTSDKRIA